MAGDEGFFYTHHKLNVIYCCNKGWVKKKRPASRYLQSVHMKVLGRDGLKKRIYSYIQGILHAMTSSRNFFMVTCMT